MRTSITAAAVAVSLAAAAAACGQSTPQRDPLPPGEAAELLHERVWLDKEPRGWSDKFHLMIFDGDHSGVYQDRTIWKGSFEVFIYEADGNTLDLRLPGSKKTVKTTFTIEKQKRGEADVKLTIDKPFEGPATYYGYKFDGGAASFVETRFGHLTPQ